MDRDVDPLFSQPPMDLLPKEYLDNPEDPDCILDDAQAYQDGIDNSRASDLNENQWNGYKGQGSPRNFEKFSSLILDEKREKTPILHIVPSGEKT